MYLMLLKDYVIYWYTNYRMPKQQRTTQICFLSTIKKHICEAPLGDLPLDMIRTKDIQLHLTECLLHGNRKKLKYVDFTGTPLSPQTVIRIRQILISMFNQAIKEDIISKNYAADTEPLSLPWQDSPVFTPETQRKFLQACRTHRFYTAYVLFFYLGCRRSELLGLSWSSVNFKRNILTIRQVLLIENGELVLRERTKTKASIRSIPFPMEIKMILQEWRQQQRSESRSPGYCNEHNLVFTNKDGSPHNPSYFSRNFKAMIKRLNFCDNRLHLHSTRHSWATNMIQCGISISDVQAIGGWSRPDTLLNIYSHTVKASQRKAMKKLYRELQ